MVNIMTPFTNKISCIFCSSIVPFIRILSWGSPPMIVTGKPIVNPVYDVSLIIKNCSQQLLFDLEPYGSRIYCDVEVMKYVSSEQPNTLINLKEKIFDYNDEKKGSVLVEIDGHKLSQEDANYISQLSEILSDNGEIGTFELGNLKIIIKSLKTFEHELIKNIKND